MGRRRFNPKTKRFNEREITRDQTSFRRGAFDDIPASDVPPDAVKYLTNCIAYGGRIEPRGGSVEWSATTLPTVATGYTWSKTGTTVTKTVGTNFAVTDIGKYLIHDLTPGVAGGTNELITAFISTTQVTVESSAVQVGSTAGSIRDQVNGTAYHHAKNRLVIHIGTKLYYASTTTIGAWNEIYRSGGKANGWELPNSSSTFAEFGNYLIVFNASGIWKIDLANTNLTASGYTWSKSGTTVTKTVGTSFASTDVGKYIKHDDGDMEKITAFISATQITVENTTPHYASVAGTIRTEIPIFYRFNVPVPATLPMGTANVAKAPTLPYGRRYTYCLSRLSGTAYDRDRTTAGVVVEQTTGTCAVNSSMVDYSFYFGARPIGDATTHYYTLTGAALGVAWDTVAEWELVVDGTFTISVDGVSKNVGACNFSGVVTMDEVATELQLKLKDSFPDYDLEVTYVTNHFVLTCWDEEIAITAATAGVGGTDIGSAALQWHAAAATLKTDNLFTTSRVLTNLTMIKDPTNTTVYADQFTHYSVYATLDVGDNGTDPITGVGNNPELYIWLADIPVIKAFMCDILETGAPGSGIGTATITTPAAGCFVREDIGAKIRMTGGTADQLSITGYTSATVVTVTGITSNRTGAAAAIGGNLATPCRSNILKQVGTLVTDEDAASPFTAADVGKTLYWGNGERTIIYEYINTTQVRATTANIGIMAAGLDPTTRMFSDIVRDDYDGATATVKQLRPRIAGLTLQNRLNTPLPCGSLGAVAGLFMFVAVREQTVLSYCQMPNGKDYYMGFYDPSTQFDKAVSAITHLEAFSDDLVVICTQYTYSIPTNTFNSDTTREAVGVISAVISQKRPVDEKVGVKNYGTITKIGRNALMMITNDGAVRQLSPQRSGLFNYAIRYSENLASDRIQNKINLLDTTAVACYSPATGYIIWGKTTV